MMLRLLSFVAALSLLPATASAAPRLPYETTIRCGEISTAIFTFGSAAAACQTGRDAIPAFSSVSAYESYYQADAAPACDAECLRPVYREMKNARLMRPLISGERVTVLSAMQDPDDHQYRICRVQTRHGTWYVLCDALANQP